MGDIDGEIIKFEYILTGWNFFDFDGLPRLVNLWYFKIS